MLLAALVLFPNYLERSISLDALKNARGVYHKPREALFNQRVMKYRVAGRHFLKLGQTGIVNELVILALRTAWVATASVSVACMLVYKRVQCACTRSRLDS